ncbi:MAG: hypothetical protein A2042_02305 [Candidatus Schekmanbacteria bacterium GWA2_38_11]|uniref:HPr kinase/phosphorylase n=1 Tax=Candidatus Schekmanbacteria bacterium GWA2_38_11 TaxID=1817876 RepID=A0A1F7RP45_9BACT|nr:MAG: hypothetical protein A2042_02305 [Candidatus Schekmanbacteria bacterium GWA2_38_11]
MAKFIRVKDLLNEMGKELQLSPLTGNLGIENTISDPQIQKPGLVLVGFLRHLHPSRVQIFGNSEISFFRTLSKKEQKKVIDDYFSSRISCLVISRVPRIPAIILESAEQRGISLIKSNLPSSDLISNITTYLENRLASTITIHGVFVEVFGVGVLILGKSGVGKSEIVLDLVVKGHRLVADDVVEIKKTSSKTLVGQSSLDIRYHMEIRGLGIINIKDLFGVTSIRSSKKIELVVELEEWRTSTEYDRLGLDEKVHKILGVKVQKIQMPVAPGRNMSMIIEVAARNHLLKKMGYHSAEELNQKLLSKIREEARTI